MALGDFYQQLHGLANATATNSITGSWGTTSGTTTTPVMTESLSSYVGKQLSGHLNAKEPSLFDILRSRPNRFSYSGVDFRRDVDYALGRHKWEARYRHMGPRMKQYTVCHHLTEEEMDAAFKGNEEVIELVIRKLHRNMAERMEKDREESSTRVRGRASQRHRKNPFDVRWLDGPGSLLDKLQKETEHWLEPVRTMMENTAHA